MTTPSTTPLNPLRLVFHEPHGWILSRLIVELFARTERVLALGDSSIPSSYPALGRRSLPLASSPRRVLPSVLTTTPSCGANEIPIDPMPR
jgi:hypothetical protein